MKKILVNILVLAMTSGIFTACVDDINVGDAFLEKAPGVEVNIDTVFNKAEYARNFLWSAYGQIYCTYTSGNMMNGAPIDVLSDSYHCYVQWGGPIQSYYPGGLTEDAQDTDNGNFQGKFSYSTKGGLDSDAGGRVSIYETVRKCWQIIENIESHKPKEGEEPSNYWIVYGLGQIGTLEGNVYSGWAETTAAEIEKSGRLVRYGLDFGFSNDETAMVAVYELEDGRLGIVEKLYRKGILGSQYGDVLRRIDVDPNVLIIADAARPEIIAEIQEAGFRCIGADKNAGSVLRGIDRVAQRQIVYSGDDLKREYLSYAWRKKRSGEILDEPEDGNDHCMDAIRYAVDDMSRKRFDF